MIKDVITWLDGSIADEVRIAAVVDITRQFEGQAAGLFFNPLPPPPAPIDGDLTGALTIATLMDQARASGDTLEKTIVDRLKRYDVAIELRQIRYPRIRYCRCRRSRSTICRHLCID